MEGLQQGGANSPAPFLTKTYDMVDDPATDHIVSWSHTSASFVVWNQLEFARDLLPKYFKHNNFSSFVRQLNTYGFRKIDPERWEFANEDFIRGQTHLLKNIHRRKPIHSHSLQHAGHGSSGPLTEGDRLELEEIIENLKREKDGLNLDLQRHMQKRDEIDIKIKSLEQRLSSMQHCQVRMLDYLGKYIQKPSFVSNFMQQYEVSGRKRRLSKPDCFLEDVNREGTSTKILQTTAGEKPDVLPQILVMEHVDKMAASLSFLENFIQSVCQASGEEMYDRTLSGLSSVVPSNMNTSSEDGDRSHSSRHLHSSPRCFGEIQSSPELTESTSYVEGPAVIPPIEHVELRPKVSEIDVNSEPTAPEASPSKGAAAVSASGVPAGGNDVFWQQFLTESPGADAQEAESQRRELTVRRNEETAIGGPRPLWWDRSNVEHLTEQMGQLTPAEKI